MREEIIKLLDQYRLKEALSQKMIELKEAIDKYKAKQKESEEQLDVLSNYLRKCI